LDPIGSSIFKKRMLDPIGAGILKKRMLDSIGSSLIKKRMLDHIGSGILKKRMLDPIGAGILKRSEVQELEDYPEYYDLYEPRRQLDEISEGFIGRSIDDMKK